MLAQNRIFSAAVAVLLSALCGCAANTDSEQPEGGPTLAGTNVASQLTDPAALSISVEESEAYIGDRILPLLSGRITLALEDSSNLRLSELSIDVGEMKFYGEEPLGTLVLQDIKVRLEEPVSAPAHFNADRTAGSASAKLDLLLDWKMVTQQGKVVPLATQQLKDAHVDLGVHVDEQGRLVAEFAGGKQGTVLAWSQLVELEDLAFDIRAQR